MANKQNNTKNLQGSSSRRQERVNKNPEKDDILSIAEQFIYYFETLDGGQMDDNSSHNS